MRRIIKRIFALVIVWMLLLACSAPASASDMKPTRVLTVAFPESDGINEIYEDGTYGGIVYDWLHEISKYTGWEYEFVTGDPSVLVSEMFEGKYDLMGGMFYFDGGEDILNYPKYVMGSNYSLLIYSRDNEAIKNYDYTTLNGMRIGVLRKAGSKIERLQKFLSYNKIDCELVYFDDEDGYESCLETGKADLLYGSDVYMRDNYNVAAMLESDPYYLVTAIDEPELCDELTAAMESIYSANSNFAKELYEKYFPGKYINSITFSPEELEYIQNRPTIRVAVASIIIRLFTKLTAIQRGLSRPAWI